MLCGISVRVFYSYTMKKNPKGFFLKKGKNIMCFIGQYPTPPKLYAKKK